MPLYYRTRVSLSVSPAKYSSSWSSDHRTREFPGSDLGPNTSYSDLEFLWFSSVPPGEFRDSTLKVGHDCFLSNHFQLLIKLLSSFIPCYIVRVTKNHPLNKLQIKYSELGTDISPHDGARETLSHLHIRFTVTKIFPNPRILTAHNEPYKCKQARHITVILWGKITKEGNNRNKLTREINGNSLICKLKYGKCKMNRKWNERNKTKNENEKNGRK
jgi:hypothetical protein